MVISFYCVLWSTVFKQGHPRKQVCSYPVEHGQLPSGYTTESSDSPPPTAMGGRLFESSFSFESRLFKSSFSFESKFCVAWILKANSLFLYWKMQYEMTTPVKTQEEKKIRATRENSPGNWSWSSDWNDKEGWSPYDLYLCSEENTFRYILETRCRALGSVLTMEST